MPASPSTARAINDRLALRHLQQDGPLTATQLKTLTGLSRPTVADLVERLRDAGLIHVVGETGADRRGPTPGSTASSRTARCWPGWTCAPTASPSSSPICWARRWPRRRCPSAARPRGTTPSSRPSRCWRPPSAARVAPLHSVGIGAPGLIDPVTGELRDSSGLPAWHRSLVRALQERLPATVLVENETNLAAVAEHRAGAARDHDTFVLLWLGHGVGAAVMLDGKLRRGPRAARARSASCRSRARSARPRPSTATGAFTRWRVRCRSANWRPVTASP